MDRASRISIRSLQAPHELLRCEGLQREIWGGGDLIVVPAHQLIAAVRNGGTVLGAFLPSGEMVGLCYGFPGLKDGKIILHSHMLGVLEEHGSQGIGRSLKLKQREYALEQGMDLIAWTFDPLEARNGHLNIHKLGGVCQTYYEDFYGEIPDHLNRGLASDRLLVEWWIRSERVAERISSPLPSRTLPDFPQIAQTESTIAGFPKITKYDLNRVEAGLLLKTPGHFQEMKRESLELAADWREKTREIFTHYLGKGYRASEFYRGAAEDSRVAFYQLDISV